MRVLSCSFLCRPRPVAIAVAVCAKVTVVGGPWHSASSKPASGERKQRPPMVSLMPEHDQPRTRGWAMFDGSRELGFRARGRGLAVRAAEVAISVFVHSTQSLISRPARAHARAVQC